MKQDYIIADASLKYMNAKNPLEESLLYDGTSGWSRNLNIAFKYSTAELAIEQARILQKEAPVKVLLLQTEGNRIGIAEVKF